MRHFVSREIIEGIKFDAEKRDINTIVRQLRPDFEYDLVAKTKDEYILSNIVLFRKGNTSLSIPGKITLRFFSGTSMLDMGTSNYFLLLILQKELADKHIFSEMRNRENYYDTLLGAKEEEEFNQALEKLSTMYPDPRFHYMAGFYMTNLLIRETRNSHRAPEIFRQHKAIAEATREFLLHPDDSRVQKKYVQAFSKVKREHHLYRMGLTLAIIGGLGAVVLLALTPFTLGFSMYIAIPGICAVIGIQTCILTRFSHGFFKEQKSITEPVHVKENVGTLLSAKP